MIRARNLIHYACVAKGATVLAQFSSTDAAALGAIAAKCLERTPPFHSNFTHTVRSRTYTFLIDEPFVYFAISDHKLEKSEGLAFLKGLRDSFLELFTGEGELEKLSSYCFQGELSSVFRRLLNVDGFRSPGGQKISQTRMLRHGSGPIRERAKPNNEMDKFKNRLLLGEGKICGRNAEKERDENGGNGTQLS